MTRKAKIISQLYRKLWLSNETDHERIDLQKAYSNAVRLRNEKTKEKK